MDSVPCSEFQGCAGSVASVRPKFDFKVAATAAVAVVVFKGLVISESYVVE